MDRRAFLRGVGVMSTGMAAGMAPKLSGLTAQSSAHPRVPSGTVAPKRLLILGGTGFIGPHMVRYAVERGHQVTIFTRGRTQADLPEVEHLIGDRNGDLTALEGREWDVVLDNNSRDYRWTQLSTELLKDSAERYLFVSSISAYAPTGLEDEERVFMEPIMDESSTRFAPPDDFEDGDEAPYGLTKALARILPRRPSPAEPPSAGRVPSLAPGTRRTGNRSWRFWPTPPSCPPRSGPDPGHRTWSSSPSTPCAGTGSACTGPGAPRRPAWMRWGLARWSSTGPMHRPTGPCRPTPPC